MATLPALTDTYTTQANVPFPDVSTSLVINQYALFATKAFLLNQLTGGTTVGTRHANSVWTCLGSGDGVTAGLDGTDRWTTTFTPSKIVGAASGTAHSWIALRNANAGYDIVFDFNSVGGGTWGWYATKSSVGLTGGSTTTRPGSAADTEAWMCGTGAVTAATATSQWGDSTTGTPHYITFVTGTTGKRWYFSGHRSGTGLAHSFAGWWEGVGAHASDTRNQWWLRSTTTAGRGAPTASNIQQGNSGCSRRTYVNTASIGSQGARIWQFGTTSVTGVGVDVLTTDYFTSPIEIGSATASAAVHFGVWPDLYYTSGGAVGGSYPLIATMERHVIGDIVAPCAVPMVL
jgi:hypothetical protein